MGSDVLAGQGGTGEGGSGGVAFDAVLDGVLAHRGAAPGREQGAAWPGGVFSEPCGQDRDGIPRSTVSPGLSCPCRGIPGGGRRPGGCRRG